MVKVDITHYAGREQAYVKHCLLENYLSSWGYIVGHEWDSLVYVDGFAGPWEAKDDKNFLDASFGRALHVLDSVVSGLGEKGKNVAAQCIFVEKDPDAFKKLDAFAKSRATQRVQAMALNGTFVESIDAINKRIAKPGSNPFKLVFLDQKGWSEAPMTKLKPFLQDRSCEVLFNLMTSHITRFLDEENREASYQELFGRPGVLEKIRSLPKGSEREEAAVREYCKSLHEICKFEYVSQAVVMNPDKDQIKYFMIFATNHSRGIEVFKKAEMEAAYTQDDVRHEKKVSKTGQPEFGFDGGPPKTQRVYELRNRYLKRAKEKVLQVLAKTPASGRVAYSKLFCEAMAFPLVRPDDLVELVEKLAPHVRLELEGEKRKKPSPQKADFVIVLNPGALK